MPVFAVHYRYVDDPDRSPRTGRRTGIFCVACWSRASCWPPAPTPRDRPVRCWCSAATAPNRSITAAGRPVPATRVWCRMPDQGLESGHGPLGGLTEDSAGRRRPVVARSSLSPGPGPDIDVTDCRQVALVSQSWLIDLCSGNLVSPVGGIAPWGNGPDMAISSALWLRFAAPERRTSMTAPTPPLLTDPHAGPRHAERRRGRDGRQQLHRDRHRGAVDGRGYRC